VAVAFTAGDALLAAGFLAAGFFAAGFLAADGAADFVVDDDARFAGGMWAPVAASL
jgi:hypothetical protein